MTERYSEHQRFEELHKKVSEGTANQEDMKAYLKSVVTSHKFNDFSLDVLGRNDTMEQKMKEMVCSIDKARREKEAEELRRYDEQVELQKELIQAVKEKKFKSLPDIIWDRWGQPLLRGSFQPGFNMICNFIGQSAWTFIGLAGIKIGVGATVFIMVVMMIVVAVLTNFLKK